MHPTTCPRSLSVAPSSPASRPGPSGGLRPALTPTPGGAAQHRSGAGRSHSDKSRSPRFEGIAGLPCPGREPHDWWEPLLPVRGDRETGFNRSEYLRAVPTTGHRHRRLYGMRQDTESLNAQLDRAFYGRRLPAWGVHNQTTVVLLAALAENAWARHVCNEAAPRHRGGQPPPQRDAA